MLRMMPSGKHMPSMEPLRSEVGAVGASSLCRECGICCGWSMFSHAGLRPGEVEMASSKQLRVLQNGKELSFRLPCPVLEAHAVERVCGDYEHRFAVCREFECDVLTSYKRGELSRVDALGLVSRARDLIASIEARLAGATVYQSVSEKLVALRVAFKHGLIAGRAAEAEALLDLGVLETLVLPAFRKPAAPGEPAIADVGTLVAPATDPDTWQRLFAPVGENVLAVRPQLTMSATDTRVRELREEGYARLGPTLAPEEAAALASIVPLLATEGWPAAFLLMHPAVWEIPRRLEPWLGATLGNDYELLAAGWAWHFTPNGQLHGAPPHRDRPDATHREDGAPDSLTVWIALTDATPENGCMYVLPREYDPHYASTPQRVDVHDVQNVRAFPAPAGTAIAWSHRLLHWGGRVSPNDSRPE